VPRRGLELDDLIVFNRNFNLGCQPRCVVYHRRRDLPSVATAAKAPEGSLPFSGLPLGSNGNRRPAGTCRDEVPLASELDLKHPESLELLSL